MRTASTLGMIFNVQRYALHDGPGVRTTVFLKGCPLSCLWCHNPEGQSRRPELVYRTSRCDLCGDCVAACEVHALSLDAGALTVAVDRCTYCGLCTTACASGALEILGRQVSVAQLIAEVERDLIFYDQSGGGVTFSGGEPLAQPAFLGAMLDACREHEIHTVLDTTGYTSPEILRGVAPNVDLFLYDLKAVDDARHRALAGVPIGPILRNLKQLVAGGRQVILRFPVIPGVNDDEDNVRQVGALAASLDGRQRIDILPYHNMAADKYRRLQKEYVLAAIEPPSAERMAQVAAMLESYGLAVHIGG